MKAKLSVNLKVQGVWKLIVEPLATVTEQMLKEGLSKGLYRFSFNKQHILDANNKSVAKVMMSDPNLQIKGVSTQPMTNETHSKDVTGDIKL